MSKISTIGPISKCRQCLTPSGGSREEYILCLLQLLSAVDIPWLKAASSQVFQGQHLHLSLCSIFISPFTLCINSLSLACFHKDACTVFRVHLDHPGQSPHFKILNGICQDSILPYQVTFTGSKDPYNPHSTIVILMCYTFPWMGAGSSNLLLIKRLWQKWCAVTSVIRL